MIATAPTLVVAAKPLTREAFAPFGDVIEVSDAARCFRVNGGCAERYHDLATLEPGPGGQIVVSIFRSRPRTLPLRVEALERHPLASQAFVPLSGRPYLVVVAPPGERPGAGGLAAFLARPDQGVNYRPGVWHHALIALDAESDFLVLDRGGPGHNCDEIQIVPAGLVRLPA